MDTNTTTKFQETLLSTLLAGAFVLTGCSVSPQTETESRPLISNGDLVGANDPAARSTIALVQPSPTFAGEYLPYCSGTLIEEDLVVTAGHCVSSRVLVAFGLGIIDSPVVIGGNAYAHEQFGSLSSPDFTYDLALVRLDRKAPAFMKPVSIAGPSDFAKGDEVFLAGYGRVVAKGSSVARTNPGLLFQVPTRISEIYPAPPSGPSTTSTENSTGRSNDGLPDPAGEDGSIDLNKIFGLIGFASDDGRSGGCQGDSGGPMYLKKGDQLLLLGSTVGGPGICAATGFYSNLSQYASWIRSTAERI